MPHAHFIAPAGTLPNGYDSTNVADETWSSLYVNLNDYLDTLRKLSEAPDSVSRQLLFPGLWTPQAQFEQRVALSDSVQDVLFAIASNSKELESIHWRELEEIVAELLRDRGLEVSVTDRSKDGGRDVIARGELIPGEPSVLAVEVKKKNVVGLHDVQRALRANEDFPALLVATTGRFSAGVIREKKRRRNKLRLFLKSGVALCQWINGWAAKRTHRSK